MNLFKTSDRTTERSELAVYGSLALACGAMLLLALEQTTRLVLNNDRIASQLSGRETLEAAASPAGESEHGSTNTARSTPGPSNSAPDTSEGV